jgi:hypothetical protein
MSELLKSALAAHGGLDRWDKLRSIRATLSVSGALFASKGRAGQLGGIEIEAQLHEQKVVTYIAGEKRRWVFQPNSIVVEADSGEKLAKHFYPRGSFQGNEAFWEEVHLAYFNSYAVWNYLTSPFLYASPGFSVEELETWREQGECWRPLKIKFPAHVVTHTKEQIAFFGGDGLLRRLEYSVDVLGGAKGLNYASDYRDFNGILLPMKRRVYPVDVRRHKVAEPVLVAIDLFEITIQ